MLGRRTLRVRWLPLVAALTLGGTGCGYNRIQQLDETAAPRVLREAGVSRSAPPGSNAWAPRRGRRTRRNAPGWNPAASPACGVSVS